MLTICFITLLFFSAYAYTIPNVQASEISIQQKGIELTNTVIGVNSTKYTAVPIQYQQNSYFGVLPQENMRYIFETQGSKIDLYYTFVNGKLQKVHVLEVQGIPQMQKSLATNSLENAKDFLSNYEWYSKNSFFGELKSMLGTVDANKNFSSISGNIMLSVTAQDESSDFRWTYIVNGIEAPDKCIALRYQDGFLNYFIDNWELYKIGSTSVNISEQEAIDIAMAKARAFTWTTVLHNETFEALHYNVTNAMVWETVFANSLYMNSTRGQDPLMLYPMRHVWVSFDKFYPGNVYGMNIYVWADTGKIGHIQERYSTIDPPEDLVATFDDIVRASTDFPSSNNTVQSNMLSVTWILLPAFGILLISLFIVHLTKKKNLSALSLPKSPSLRIGGLILCLLIASTVFIEISALTVDALPYNGRATIWGSESRGAWNTTLSQSWRKHPYEVARQQATSAFIQSKFTLNGYSASDYQGSKGSDKNSTLYQIQTNDQNYPRIAVVDFDHGNGNNETNIMGAPSSEFHYLFEDQTGTRLGGTYPGTTVVGNGVYDMEIYPRTTSGRYFFVLINACNSAHIEDTMGNPPNQQITTQGLISDRARGMPFAWTHRLVKNRDTFLGFNTAQHMSDDGYARPDTGNFVYLGFKYGSAALNQTIDGQVPYWWWLEHFFAYALTNNFAVNQALNEASQYFFSGNFGQSPLGRPEGFNAIWPMYKNGQWNYTGSDVVGTGHLKVYGNGDLKLYQPLLNVNAYDLNNNQVWPTFYIDGNSHGTGSLKLYSGSHSITVSDIAGYTFRYFTYNGQTYYSRPATLSITSDSTITARYERNQEPPSTPSLNGPSPAPPTYVGQSYSFWASSTDPNGDQIRYTFNWGDSTSTTTGWYSSGATAYASHTWTSTGQFSVTVTAEDSTGRFSGQSSPINVNIQNPPTYYTLSISSGSGGTTSPSAGQYQYVAGTQVQVTAYENSGYDFDHWVLDGQNAGSQNPITVTMNSNHNLQPVFYEIPTYSLTISSSTGGYTNPSGVQEYLEGTPAQVYAYANTNYEFDYWLLDGQNAGSNNPITVTMNDDHELQAVFCEVTTYHWLYIDGYWSGLGYMIFTDIYVDGDWVGAGSAAVQVTEGYHSVQVDYGAYDEWGYPYLFDYFIHGGTYYYDNPASVPVYEDMFTTAYYTPYGK